ncbi:MAG: MFS transporter [Chloroflexota bacterium]|nr:MFS transporter [Chloroflexota bacterium]
MDGNQTQSGQPRHDPFAALRFGDFRLLVVGSFIAVIAEQMLGVAVGWDLYLRTNSPLALGLVGLVEIVPVILLALPAGHIADRWNRKWIVVAAVGVVAACTLGLGGLSAAAGPLLGIYGLLFGIGLARAFQSPAFSSLTAQVVPPESFGSAATWSSGAWQTASIIGPAAGGLLLATSLGPVSVYVGAGFGLLLSAALLALMHPIVAERVAEPEPLSISSLLAGARFIRSTPEILAAITLDMFAVLLGGATALLPVFARDILQVGAVGLGWLRAAPAIGALTAALVMTLLPPFRRAGSTLLLVVAGFGVATIIFGLSLSFWLSLAMLAILGALDNISVVIRSTLLLTRTPDAVRGRVNAVHYVFIGISNELGAFESGVAAAFLSAVGAVVAGGVGTILVVAVVAARWPQLRRLGRLDGRGEKAAPEATEGIA